MIKERELNLSERWCSLVKIKKMIKRFCKNRIRGVIKECLSLNHEKEKVCERIKLRIIKRSSSVKSVKCG